MLHDRTLILLFFAVALLSAASSTAADGVFEINQTCATATGCFAGDTPGFPVTIGGGAGHSFRLTSDLTVPPDADGINVASDAGQIAINLAGFTILRDGCQNIGILNSPCYDSQPAAGTAGIKALGGNGHIDVYGGSIIGTSHGVWINPASTIHDLQLTLNNEYAIRMGGGRIEDNFIQDCGNGIQTSLAEVEGNTIRQCEDIAISNPRGSVIDNKLHSARIGIWGGAIIRGNLVYAVREAGIVVRNGDIALDDAAIVSGNRITNVYEGRGIEVFSGSLVEGNVVSGASQEGIYAGAGSTVARNTVTRSGGDGIYAEIGCSVQGNSVAFNGKAGMTLIGSASYRANAINNNLGGTVFGGLNRGENVCDGALACP